MYENFWQTQRNPGKRGDQYQKLSYNIEPEIEILFASLVFAISLVLVFTAIQSHKQTGRLLFLLDLEDAILDFTGGQAFSQDFESGSPNFVWAEGPHSMVPQAPCS